MSNYNSNYAFIDPSISDFSVTKSSIKLPNIALEYDSYNACS